jgi:hypothetical protein
MGCISGPGVWRNDVFLVLLKLTLVLISVAVNGIEFQTGMPCFRLNQIHIPTIQY